jgi:hypothetical protein
MTPPTSPPDESAHLSADTLADLDAGLLAADERSQAERHLSGCTTCRATRTALADVSAQLGAAAWRDPIPADVATRVEAALAREAMAAREPVTPVVPQQRRRGWVPRVLGTAAALSVIGGVAYVAGTAGDNGQQGGSTTAESAAEPPTAARQDDAGSDRAAESAELDDVAAATRTLAAAGQTAPAVPDTGAGEQQGRQHFTATCGQSLAEELDRTLLAATPYTFAGRDAILVAVSGPSADLVSGYVLPDCEAGATDAYVAVDIPRE